MTSQFNENGILNCEVKFAPFALPQRPKRPVRSQPEELEISAIVVESLSSSLQLHRFPKQEILICVEILECGGDELSGAITCSSLALAASGIDMYDLVGATTSAFVSRIGAVQRPPVSVLNHPKCRGSLTMAYMPALDQVLYMEQVGYVKPDDMSILLGESLKECRNVTKAMQSALVAHALSKEEQEE
jgi:exosome complex component MTR3